MDYSERLLNSTVRIEATFLDGSVGTGTGFFFGFHFETSISVNSPVIVTNKHVVSDDVELSGISLAETLKLFLKERTPQGEPDFTKVFELELENITSFLIEHPDTDIDLCVIPLSVIVQKAKEMGRTVYFDIFGETAIPTQEINDELLAIEQVYMVGYPNGLWDELHNLPITRRGITATHPNIDYNGRKEFVIDIAAFPGSSGSPVFLYDPSLYQTRKNIKMNGRIYLLGIFYAGDFIPIEGSVKLKRSDAIAKTNIPMNLGYVIKSVLLLDFVKPLKALHFALGGT